MRGGIASCASSGPCTWIASGQLIDADDGTVKLYPDRDETDLIELRGNSRVTGGGTMGALQSMSAKDMNLKYGEDGRTLQHATLAGGAAIDRRHQERQRRAEVGRRAHGHRPRARRQRAHAHGARGGRGHAAGHEGHWGRAPSGRPSLTATGNPQGLREMKFDEKVEYREAATKTQGARVVRARTLEADLESATGALAEAHFIGDVDFTDGPMHATSVDAVYKVAEGHLTLSGKERRPHIENDALVDRRQCHRRHAQPALADGHRPRQQHHAAVEEARRQRAGGQSTGLARRSGNGRHRRREADLRRDHAQGGVHRPGAPAAGRDQHQRRRADASTRPKAT